MSLKAEHGTGRGIRTSKWRKTANVSENDTDRCYNEVSLMSKQCTAGVCIPFSMHAGYLVVSYTPEY